jgi:hypothetical protein
MATVIEKPVRLVNPGRKGPRRMTARQKLFFGSKRQRTAARASLHNPRKKFTFKKYKYKSKNRKIAKSRTSAQETYNRRRHDARKSRFMSNVGEIITIIPKVLTNSGVSKNKKRKVIKNNNKMAKSSRRRSISHAAAVKRGRKAARTRARRRNPGTPKAHTRRRARRYNRNPQVKTVVRYRTRRNTGRRVSHRRRLGNPGGGMFKSTIGQALGVIGGAFVTSTAYGALNSFTPTFSSGIMAYLAIGVIATLQGQAVGKLLKNPALGRDMTIGGFVYLALKVAADMFPGVSLGISGGRGMGSIIGPSSFYTPQVPLNGSMGTFVTPAAVAAAARAAMPMSTSPGGMGNVRMMRRGGRTR